MTKLRNIIKNLLLGLTLVCGVQGFAQVDKLNKAITLHQSKNSDAARSAIDSVIRHPDTKKEALSWTTRAYIYYEIYKRNEKGMFYSPLRDTIIASLKTSYKLSPDADITVNNNRLMQNMSVVYYNFSLKFLRDSINYAKSLNLYNNSKDLCKIARPDSNFTKADIEYYNMVGGVYSDIFNKDNLNLKAQEIAKLTLLKVLEIQPDNGKANYNLGIMYYNQAANLGKSLDYGADISQIDVIQESIIKLGKQSEQLIIKVHKKEPKNVKVIEALYFIYRMLYDSVKAEEYKKKCIDNGIKVE